MYNNTLVHSDEQGDTFVAEAGSEVDFSEATVLLPGQDNPGAAATGMTVTESSMGVNKTVITLSAISVTMTDATTAGNQGSKELYDLPAGNILFLGGITNLTTLAGVGGVSDTAALVGAVGSAVASNADATLTGTEANIIPSSTGTLAAGAGTLKGKSTAPVTLDGTSSAVKVYLNLAIPDAGSTGNDTIVVNGTVTLFWMNLGDN